MIANLTAALGIRVGSKISVINPPKGFLDRLNPLPEGVAFLLTAATGLDVILFFTTNPLELASRLPALSRAMAVNGGIWVLWPKGELAHGGLDEDTVRATALDLGLVDDKIQPVDEVWTGLRLVWKPRPRLDKPERRAQVPGAQA